MAKAQRDMEAEATRVSLHGVQVVSWRNDRGDELLFTNNKVCLSSLFTSALSVLVSSPVLSCAVPVVVPLRPEEVWQRGLEEHFAQFRADVDADAGRQPCTCSALAEARTRGGMPTSKALLFSSLLVRNWNSYTATEASYQTAAAVIVGYYLYVLQEEFEEYAEKAKTLPDTTTDGSKLCLYSLYKQATVGPVNTGIFTFYAPFLSILLVLVTSEL
ncbi:hypothetical protein ZWY2020_035121 [Hordeum vulgare]|nr:hypothetical protein ZWY2020_035121 [Hordeum vulgare]